MFGFVQNRGQNVTHWLLCIAINCCVLAVYTAAAASAWLLVT